MNKKSRKGLFKYILALLVGVLLIPSAHKAATQQRGHEDFGGEFLLPVLTVGIVYLIDEVKFIVKDARTEQEVEDDGDDRI